jgi:hypothetical protein
MNSRWNERSAAYNYHQHHHHHHHQQQQRMPGWNAQFGMYR